MKLYLLIIVLIGYCFNINSAGGCCENNGGGCCCKCCGGGGDNLRKTKDKIPTYKKDPTTGKSNISKKSPDISDKKSEDNILMISSKNGNKNKKGKTDLKNITPNPNFSTKQPDGISEVSVKVEHVGNEWGKIPYYQAAQQNIKINKKDTLNNEGKFSGVSVEFESDEGWNKEEVEKKDPEYVKKITINHDKIIVIFDNDDLKEYSREGNIKHGTDKDGTDYNYSLFYCPYVSKKYIRDNIEINVDISFIDIPYIVAHIIDNCYNNCLVFASSENSTFKKVFYFCKSGYIKILMSRGIKSTNGMFSCSVATKIDVSKLDTNNVTDMSFMFNNCKDLSEIVGLDKFNTIKVTNMSYMFYKCKNLINIDLNSFNTSKVTNMAYMFAKCDDLCKSKSYDPVAIEGLEQLNIACVEDMSYMFHDCKNIRRIVLNGANKGVVKNMKGMFEGCSKLEKFYGYNLDTSNVESMESMFKGCKYLEKVYICNFITNNVTNMSNMFCECRSLSSISGISKWNTSKVTNMSNMFNGCEELTSLPDISKWNTSSVTDMSNMFNKCIKLKNIKLSKFNTSNVTNMSYMFYECSELNELNIASFLFNKSLVCKDMFTRCTKLERVYVNAPEVNVKKKNIKDNFNNCGIISCELNNEGFIRRNSKVWERKSDNPDSDSDSDD